MTPLAPLVERQVEEVDQVVDQADQVVVQNLLAVYRLRVAVQVKVAVQVRAAQLDLAVAQLREAQLDLVAAQLKVAHLRVAHLKAFQHSLMFIPEPFHHYLISQLEILHQQWRPPLEELSHHKVVVVHRHQAAPAKVAVVLNLAVLQEEGAGPEDSKRSKR